MPNVESLTPSIIWTTIYGFIALCLLITIVLTAAEKIRNIRAYKQQKEEAGRPNLADQISKKVMEQLEPRLKDIEDKLKSDKSRLDNHATLLAQLERTNSDVRSGLHAYGKVMLAILNHGVLGESAEVNEAADELHRFLADRL